MRKPFYRRGTFQIVFAFAAIIASIISCEHEPIFRALPSDDSTNEVDTGICFERDILPIFQNSCATTNCHNSITQKDEYVLDNYDNITKKGIVKGSAASSKIYEVIRKNEMPQNPVPKLTDAQKNLIKRWIDGGAKNGTNCPIKCDTATFTYTDAVKKITANYCTGCHNSLDSQAGINLSTYWGTRNAALNGKLWNSLNRTTAWMPQGGNRLSDCELTQIKKWTNAGAPNN
ncbi:MAG: hypothetical protein KG003_15800 [Bacteroidetes bacterium]|nr:hypothetical protein [Bacteroidota bacterium]